MEVYQAALKVNPKNVRALINLAKLFSTHLHNTQKALELAKTAHKLAPDDPEVSHTLGRLAYQTGDYKLALGLLQETVRGKPGEPETLFDLAEASYSVGKVADAEAAMRSALQTGAAFSRIDEAKRFLDMIALAANPSQAVSATARVEEILKSNPDYVPALVVSAVISEQKANANLAKQTYEKVLSQYPDFAPAQKQLAILYSADPANDTKTYPLAIKSRDTFPDDPDLARILGIIVYRQGDYARSEKFLKESAARKDGDAVLLYYLGMAQYRLKNRAGSKATLQRASELNLSGKPAEEAKRILMELNKPT
jgi:tetratricopeptide (TPR) repeat protein